MTGKLNIPKAEKSNWETPASVFDQLDARFGPFDLDPACELDQYSALTILSRGGSVCIPPNTTSPDGLKEEVYTRILDDGLEQPWRGKVWLNPPYGAGLGIWVPKAVAEVEAGNAELVCALLPAYTGPKWWQHHIFRQVRWEPGHATGQEWVPDGWVVGAHPLLYQLDFLAGRIQFVGAPGPANFDSAVVVWKKRGTLRAPTGGSGAFGTPDGQP